MYPPRCRWCGLCLPLQQIGGCVYLRGPLFVPAWLCCLFVSVCLPLSPSFSLMAFVFCLLCLQKGGSSIIYEFLVIFVYTTLVLHFLTLSCLGVTNLPVQFRLQNRVSLLSHDCNVNVLRWCILFGVYAGATYTLTQHGHLWLLLSLPSHEIGKGSTAPNRNAT